MVWQRGPKKSVISNPFVTRSHEMSLKNGQFEISTSQISRSARYFLLLNHVIAKKKKKKKNVGVTRF